MKNLKSPIKHKIEQIKTGKIFGIQELLPYGTYENVRQILARKAKGGQIRRIGRGLYVKPKQIEQIGQVLPSINEIIEKLESVTKETICMHGNEALRRLRLSTQVQMMPVYNTSGKSRVINIANKKIELRHISEKN
ncbi:MAG TPA: DUF6088 family protein [Aquella sp.]|nr:DUF6088 family protein [Aquella sp.]